MLTEALNLMGVGLGVVFSVLALFYFVIRLLMRLFHKKEREPGQK